MRVHASVEEATLTNDDGYDVEGVIVTCDRCQHTTESFGTTSSSVKRCLAMLREECPHKERNFYVTEGGDV
jgi:hypothetical protein